MRIVCKFEFADKPRGSFETIAENVVDPLLQPGIIFTENDMVVAKLTKILQNVIWNAGWNVDDGKKVI